MQLYFYFLILCYEILWYNNILIYLEIGFRFIKQQSTTKTTLDSRVLNYLLYYTA